MKKLSTIIVSASLLLGAVAAGEQSAHAPKAVNVAAIPVKTARALTRQLSETLTAYGEVQPDPDSLIAINTGYAGQVRQLPISLGQCVAAGDTLLELDTDPAARMGYLQAVAEVEYARNELNRKRTLFSDQLATRGEVAAAEKALQDAETALATQRSLGTDQTRQVIRAPFSGVVVGLNVALGDRAHAGATLLNLARRGNLLIALGVEPEEIERVTAGMPVTVAPVFDTSRTIETKVAEVHGMVSPATRLIDVAVRLDEAEAAFLVPGMRIRGILTTANVRALAVPRAALLTEKTADQKSRPIGRASHGAQSYLFRVVDGRARRVNVKTGLSDAGLVAVEDGIRSGDRVIILGNYELTDGAAVAEPKP